MAASAFVNPRQELGRLRTTNNDYLLSIYDFVITGNPTIQNHGILEVESV